MQHHMWIFLLAFPLEVYAEEVISRQWPQVTENLPEWLRHPEDWADDPTAPPPDPRLAKHKADVKQLLSSVKHAMPSKHQWQLAASINDNEIIKVDNPPERHVVVLSSLDNGLNLRGRRTSDMETQNQEHLPGLFRPPPNPFHDAQKLLHHVKAHESHLAGLKGNDDTPDEFLWRNLSEFKVRQPFNSTFWIPLCAKHGKNAVGIWKQVCAQKTDLYHVRFRKTICDADVKAIAKGDTDDHCAEEVAKDKECSKVFHFIPSDASPECKCVKKDKVCKPKDNDKGGTVYFLE